MIDPITLSLVASAVPAAVQGITGLIQNRKANRLASGLQDPVYDIPQSAVRALANAQNQSYSRQMSGQANLQNDLEQRQAASTSDVLRTATSGAEALAALTSLNQNGLMAQNQIGFRAAQDYEARQNALRNQLGVMAGYEDKAFEINEMQPFLRDAAAASALKNAGINNMYQGIKGLAGAAATGLGNMQGGDVKSMDAGVAAPIDHTGYTMSESLVPKMGGMSDWAKALQAMQFNKWNGGLNTLNK